MESSTKTKMDKYCMSVRNAYLEMASNDPRGFLRVYSHNFADFPLFIPVLDSLLLDSTHLDNVKGD
ncbi:hypothetical protein CASFOL_038755 [Castilleja foliolosa]|uniref:Uncharacterized protein n=1 Tax=Castilleja foliolosa TaxID=1961234 RepID=A0ABD3BME1_9LAMI